MKLFYTIALLCLICSSVQAQDIPSLLKQADKLKHAEKYQAAEKLYDDILKIEPANLEAQINTNRKRIK